MLRIVIITLSALGMIALSLWAGQVQLFPPSTMAWYERPVQDYALRLTSWLLNGMGMKSQVEVSGPDSMLTCRHPTAAWSVTFTRGAMFGRSNTLVLPALLLACVASWTIVFTWELGWIRRVLILLSAGMLLHTPFVIGAVYAVAIAGWAARPPALAIIVRSHIIESTGMVATTLVTAGFWWVVKAIVSTEADAAAAPEPARPPFVWASLIATGSCAASVLLHPVVLGLLKPDSTVQFLLWPFLALLVSCLLLTLGLRGSAWGLKLSWIPIVPAALLAPAVGGELAGICLFLLVVVAINSKSTSEWLTGRASSGCPSAGKALFRGEANSRTPAYGKDGGP